VSGLVRKPSFRIDSDYSDYSDYSENTMANEGIMTFAQFVPHGAPPHAARSVALYPGIPVDEVARYAVLDARS